MRPAGVPGKWVEFCACRLRVVRRRIACDHAPMSWFKRPHRRLIPGLFARLDLGMFHRRMRTTQRDREFAELSAGGRWIRTSSSARDGSTVWVGGADRAMIRRRRRSLGTARMNSASAPRARNSPTNGTVVSTVWPNSIRRACPTSPRLPPIIPRSRCWAIAAHQPTSFHVIGGVSTPGFMIGGPLRMWDAWVFLVIRGDLRCTCHSAIRGSGPRGSTLTAGADGTST